MSMLELDVKLPELDGLVKDLGLEEGGRAQQHPHCMWWTVFP